MRTDAPDVACADRVTKEGQLLTGLLRIRQGLMDSLASSLRLTDVWRSKTHGIR